MLLWCHCTLQRIFVVPCSDLHLRPTPLALRPRACTGCTFGTVAVVSLYAVTVSSLSLRSGLVHLRPQHHAPGRRAVFSNSNLSVTVAVASTAAKDLNLTSYCCCSVARRVSLVFTVAWFTFDPTPPPATPHRTTRLLIPLLALYCCCSVTARCNVLVPGE